MITKYIKSFFYSMLLFINPLSCGLDYEQGVMKLDKTVYSADSSYYLLHRGMQLFFELLLINFEALKKDCPDDIDKDNKKLLLQYFIDYFYDPEFIVKVSSMRAVDGKIEIGLVARQFKINDEELVLSEYCYTNMSGSGSVRKDKKECQIESRLLLTKVIDELHKIDLIEYFMCSVDDYKSGIIIDLCNFYKDNIMQSKTADKDKKENLCRVINQMIEVIDVKLNLSADEFIEQNEQLGERLSDNIIDMLKTFPGYTLQEVLNDIRQTVLIFYRNTECEDQRFKGLLDLDHRGDRPWHSLQRQPIEKKELI